LPDDVLVQAGPGPEDVRLIIHEPVLVFVEAESLY